MIKDVVALVVAAVAVVVGLTAFVVNAASKKTDSSRSSTRRDSARNTQSSGATNTRRNTTTIRRNTTTDHQPATVRRRNTATTRRDSVYKISPYGGLLCNMECLLIGSFGDELAPGVKVIPKRFCKPIGPYLAGVKQDLETMKSKIDKDPSKTLACSLVDCPEDQRPKEEYLQLIEEFLTQCETPGGEAFTQLM